MPTLDDIRMAKDYAHYKIDKAERLVRVLKSGGALCRSDGSIHPSILDRLDDMLEEAKQAHRRYMRMQNEFRNSLRTPF